MYNSWFTSFFLQYLFQDCTFQYRQYSCARIGDSDSVTAGFDVNNSMMLCFNELGCGEAAMRKFSAVMCIPGFAHNTYRRLSKKIGKAHEEVTANVLRAGVRAVRAAYGAGDEQDGNEHGESSDQDGDDGNDSGGDDDDDGGAIGQCYNDYACGVNEDDGGGGNDGGDGDQEEGGSNDFDVHEGNFPDSDDSDSTVDYDYQAVNNENVVDVTVSFDGTWHKRGFTSNYGVGIVIDAMTGFVLDYTVLSKYCQACTVNSSRPMTEYEKLEWKRLTSHSVRLIMKGPQREWKGRLP